MIRSKLGNPCKLRYGEKTLRFETTPMQDFYVDDKLDKPHQSYIITN